MVEWKLTRGKWRPKLLDYAKNASEEEVKAATKKAFGSVRNDAVPAVQQVKESLDELTTLKGVGPATASAMLAVADPSLPFMSDEAMVAALPKPHRYAAKEYLQLLEALRNKAAKLSKSSDTAWTAAQIERALWSEALSKQLSTKTSKGTKRKR